MKYVFDLNEIESIPAFSPPHHTTTKDRKLVDETIGAKNLAIWHGEMGAGGKADPHVHEEMEHAFFVLDGEAIFRFGEEERRVGKGCLVFVPAKLPHELTSIGQVPLKVLIIMAPPPESLAVWKKK
jgi:mannose-6-phosphate isomerase-like protein (cupin superfamily)